MIMAVAENASQNFENTTTVVSSSESNAQNDLENSKPRNDSMENKNDQKERPVAGTAATTFSVATGNYKVQMSPMANGFDSNGVKSQQMGVVKAGGGYGSNNQRANGAVARNGEDGGESFKRDMRDLEELLSKLNPMAEEFVPPSLANNHGYFDGGAGGFGFTNNFVVQTNFGNANANGLNGRRVCPCSLSFSAVWLLREWRTSSDNNVLSVILPKEKEANLSFVFFICFGF